MKANIIFLLVLVLPAIFAIRDDDFQNFILKYKKHYTSDEFQRRLNIFRENKAEIARLNHQSFEKNLTTKFGINKFADLSKEEFKAKYMGYKPSHVESKIEETLHLTAPLPASLDWRTKGAVSPIKNQEQCGSCWAFSATEGVESAWFLSKGQLLQLSPQQIVSCDTYDGGCNGGDLPTAFQYVQQNGLETGAVYPYTSGNGDSGTCNYNSQDVVAHISGFKYATTSGNETQMQVAMVTNGPLSICVDAETWQYYQSGVITHGCGDSLDHCVQIVGWSQTSANVPYWIIRNSWGTDWGLNGYLWVERNKDECGVSDEATWVTI